MIDLKPCPFCGGGAKVEIYEDAWDSYATVECQECGASAKKWPYVFEFEEQGATDRAVESWNRRTCTCGKDGQQ